MCGSREFEVATPFGITLADGLRGTSDGGNEIGIVRKNGSKLYLGVEFRTFLIFRQKNRHRRHFIL